MTLAITQVAGDRRMEVTEAIGSLRSCRSFLDKPVEKEKLVKLLEAASKAASGSNTQPWEFVVVTEAKMKEAVGKPMAEAWNRMMGSSYGRSMTGRRCALYDDATRMVEETGKAPALIFACLDLNRVSRAEETRYASIYPAVQNLMLAAQAIGLGTCLTVHGSTPTRGEPEVKKILGIPDNVKIACCVYTGYPSRKMGRPERRPSSGFAHWNKW